MRADVTPRRWRRFSAVVQLILFAFSASTSLLPCANDMGASTTEQVAIAHHVANSSPDSHALHASNASHDASSSHASHTTEDASPPAAPVHHGATSSSCPWVVGCTGMAQFEFESSWRVLETTPVVSAPAGVVLRAVTAEREVESPPPRA